METTDFTQTVFDFDATSVESCANFTSNKILSFKDFSQSLKTTRQCVSDEVVKARRSALIAHYLCHEA